MTGIASVPRLAGSWRAGSIIRSLSLTPFALALAVALTSPVFFGHTRSNDIFGAPPVLVIEAIALAWAGLAAFFIWRTHSRAVVSLALLAGTAPSMLMVVLTPALVLIMLDAI